MTSRRIVLTLAMILIVAGCHRVAVRQDYHPGYDFSKLKTFQWLAPGSHKQTSLQLTNPFLDARVRTAVERTLSRRGYRVASTGRPDFMVTYHHQTKQRLESNPVRTGVGFGTGSRGSYAGIGFGTGVDLDTYDQGILIIDLIQADSGDLAWRGTGTRRIHHQAGPQEAAIEINETVERILSQFPPGHNSL